MLQPILREIAERHNQDLTPEIRDYLTKRGVPVTLIHDQLLGWNGSQITIPIFGREKEVLGFRYAKVSGAEPDNVQVTSSIGLKPELYGWESLARAPHRVVICAREFDRLVLEAKGFPAVCSTGGAAEFSEEWVPAFERVNRVYICFDRSLSGAAAARKVQRLIPRARIVTLPQDVGEDGSVSNYFVDDGSTATDFEMLLAKAASATSDSGAMPEIRIPRPADKKAKRRAEHARRAVHLVDIVSLFASLRASGSVLVGSCPLHNDHLRSFTLYPQSDTYRCTGCGSEGDVVKFLVDKESMSYGQALDALERFQITGELYGTSS